LRARIARVEDLGALVSAHTEDVITHHGELESQTNSLQRPFTHETLGRKAREVLDQR
jgi:hypothetical protein